MPTLSEDIKYINDVVNTISIRSTNSSRIHHRSICERLSERLNDHLIDQLVSISSVLVREPKIIMDYRRYNDVFKRVYGDDPTKEYQDLHMYLSILNYINSSISRSLKDDRFRNHMYVYRGSDGISMNDRMKNLPKTSNIVPFSHNVSGDTEISSLRYILPTQMIVSTNISCIIRGILMTDIDNSTVWHDGPREVVMKISNEPCLVNEISVYRKSIERDIPGVILGFEFMGNPVLVMEPMSPLDVDESSLPDVFKSILRQLRELHQIGVHCDIKPDNIMMVDGSYYLIDFGGVTPMDSKRFTYTHSFSTQRPTSKNPSKKCDLLELIYTMNHLSIRSKKKDVRSFRYDLDEIWKKAWKIVVEWDEISPSVYDRLINVVR